jgi:NADH:ubiquinone reductase (H+-translocating)
MEQKTLVIIGGGYAGINLIDQLRKKYKKDADRKIKIILIDKNAYHFRKVKLFKAIVEEETQELNVPFEHYHKGEFQFIQGEMNEICKDHQTITLVDSTGNLIDIHYDWLVITIGGILREVEPMCGGTSLCNVQHARKIRNDLLSIIDSKERLKVAVIGGGITGVETAAEINNWLKRVFINKGISPTNLEVYLIHNKESIGDNIPKAASKRLEEQLKKHGVQIIHQTKAQALLNDILYLENGIDLEMDYCIWTVGVQSNPCLYEWKLPLTKDGKIVVNDWYQVKNCNNIFAIGDCTHIVDPKCNEIAEMTCKEAISQAKRLVTIIRAAEHKRKVPVHQNYPKLYCIGLGPGDGFVWAKKWGMHFMLTGYMASKIRDYTWDMASLLD